MGIVPLDELKDALGITGDEQDAELTRLEGEIAEWIDGQTKRRFQEPVELTEFRTGQGRRILYLAGHIHSADPLATGLVEVQDRPLIGGDWIDREEGEDYERRGDQLVSLGMPLSLAWMRTLEYKITYLNGYPPGEAPEDIKAVVIEMVNLFLGGGAAASGVVSERIGDYSYSLDSSAAADDLTATSRATINRWKRLLV